MLIECKNVCFQYNKDKVLTDINLQISSNTLLTGDSGCGKTTLLHILGGILQPSSGTVERLGKIAFIFQSPSLISTLTALDNIAIVATIEGQSWSSARGQAKDLLDRVGMGSHGHKLPDTLSGGQAQRVAIARAMIAKPDIILCDEPTGSLDERNSTNVLDLLFSTGAYLCMISHNVGIRHRFDKHYMMSNRQLVQV